MDGTLNVPEMAEADPRARQTGFQFRLLRGIPVNSRLPAFWRFDSKRVLLWRFEVKIGLTEARSALVR
jgi:hypothetical protein